MKNFYFIGVDVSKKKLDFCIMLDGKVIHEEIVSNHQMAITRFITNFQSGLEVESDQFLICAEHTGQYTYLLACACDSIGCNLWLETPNQIKFSSGMQRGKNDKVDAQRIALYASRFADKQIRHKLPAIQIEKLDQLSKERNLYVSDVAKFKGQLADQEEFMAKEIFEAKAKRLKGIIKELTKAIETIESEIENIIYTSTELYRQMQLLTSIEGIGKVVALAMIIETRAFTRFDDPRKFICHAGVAPFSYTSGSSQRSASKVSHMANKNIKRLIHLSAVTIIRRKSGAMKEYYERKVAEGKNKMSVINALRAKLIIRMFAVIKRDKPYLSSIS